LRSRPPRPSTVPPGRRVVRAAALCLSLAAAAAACDGAPTAAGDATALRADRFPTGDQTADAATLDDFRRRARGLARRDGCARGEDCGAIALGAKPCGGPWEYVVYCRTSTEEPALRAAAAQLDSAERRFNDRYALGSTCDVPPEPVPGLQGGGCAAK
jgi:hypothetical protein